MNKKISILIVEDSEDDALLVIRQFKKENYDVTFKRVETAYQMQTALEDASWDLVISDYNLPEFDAPSALTVLQKSGQDIPFIVVSGVIGEETAVALMRAGAHDYIMKGNLTRLIPAVNRELDEVQTRRAKQQADKEIKQAAEEWIKTFDAMTDLVSIQDMDYRLVKVNQAYAQAVGMSPYALVGQHCYEVLHGTVCPFVECPHEQMLLTIKPVTKEIFEANLGIYLEVTISPIVDVDGTLIGSVHIAKNITDRKQAEVLLKESEEQFRSIFENSVDAIFLTVPDGTILAANPEACRMFGRSEQEICQVGRDGMADYSDSLYFEATKERKQRGAYSEKEGFHLRKDGSRFPTEVSSSIFLDKDGHERAIVTIRDITERKKAEQKLIESEERLRLSLEAANDGIWDWNIQTGSTFFSPRCYIMLGYEDKEFPETFEFWQNAFDPDDIDKVKEAIKENLKSGKKCVVEARARTKTGEWRWIETRGMVVERDDNGRAIRMVGTHSDVTVRKESETNLIESEERYRMAIECSNDGIVIGKEGLHIYVNQRFLEMFGFEKPDDVLGKPASIIAHPEDREMLMEMNLKRHKGENVSHKYEFRGLHKDGRTVFIEVSATAIFYRGEQHSLAVLRDITSRKIAEEELAGAAERLRKSLAGTLQAMAHTVEIRDPYTAGHEKRVSALARSIAQEMGLSNAVIDTIRMAASVHDVGKMSVPAEILSKPSRLLEIEMNLIKIHSQAGYDILKDSELPYPVAEIVLQHHERLDGSGYPQELKDDEILLEAQILSIADVVEAMASHRPYRPALGIDIALEEIEKNKGILYNVGAVEACVRLFREKGFTFG
jgi:PAS domain S-box-containing protein/putative nucleotidyltransferase with HDIG domain